MERLSPTYLSLSDIEYVEGEIAARLHNCLNDLDAGQINDDGNLFLNRCLGIIEKIHNDRSSSSKTPLSFYQGYMYELTNRCLHQFSRQ